MGANEKHAAAYHGGEYAPVTESVRERYMRDRFETDWVEPVNSRAEFDRWLEGVRSEAKDPAEQDDDGRLEPTVRIDPKQTVVFNLPAGELRVRLSEDRQRLEIREASIYLPRLFVEPISANCLSIVLGAR